MNNTDIAALLGKRIKELRELRGLSQAELASRSLKSVETISNFERAKTTPSVGTLAALARILEIDISEFFSHEVSSKADVSALTDRMRLLSSDDQLLLSLFVDSLLKRKTQQ